MDMVLGFLPFIAFVVLANRVAPALALTVGALVALATMLRALMSNRRIKILEIGTIFLFGALAVYTVSASVSPSLVAVRLCVDTGLALIVTLSMVVGQPFTLQYARERVDPTRWNSPSFIRANYVLTAAWAAIFSLIASIEAAMLIYPQISQAAGFTVVGLALVSGFAFTPWYSKRARTAADRLKDAQSS